MPRHDAHDNAQGFFPVKAATKDGAIVASGQKVLRFQIPGHGKILSVPELYFSTKVLTGQFEYSNLNVGFAGRG